MRGCTVSSVGEGDLQLGHVERKSVVALSHVEAEAEASGHRQLDGLLALQRRRRRLAGGALLHQHGRDLNERAWLSRRPATLRPPSMASALAFTGCLAATGLTSCQASSSAPSPGVK